MREERIWDAVVVGAGAAGLLASVHLAKAGWKVLVLERGAAPGGRAMTTELEGALVNLGPHALYEEALRVLKEVGVEPTGRAPNVNGAMVLSTEPAGFRAVPMLGLLLGRSLTWGEKTELIRFFASLRRIETGALQHVSLHDYLAEHIRHPRVRLMIQSFVRVSTYCNASLIVSAGAMIDQLKKAAVIYPNGGWQTIVDALCAQAERSGVTLLTQAGVQRITGQAPELAVELKSGERIRTRTVLSTTGPKPLLELLDAAPAPAYEARLRSLVPMYAACLDVVLDGLPAPKTNFALGIDRPLYYSNHSRAARLSSNPNRHVVHAMNYLPAGAQVPSGPEESGLEASEAASGPAAPEASEAELERMLDTLQPGWKSRVVARRYMPHMLVSHAVVTAESGGLQGRPEPAVAGIPGVYAAGDWVGSEGMLLNAALYSARKAAQVMIEDSKARTGMRE